MKIPVTVYEKVDWIYNRSLYMTNDTFLGYVSIPGEGFYRVSVV